jgi:hypothetical protein
MLQVMVELRAIERNTSEALGADTLTTVVAQEIAPGQS